MSPPKLDKINFEKMVKIVHWEKNAIESIAFLSKACLSLI